MSGGPRVLHVLSTLSRGGAETNAVRLIPFLQSRGVDQRVVSLTPQIDPALADALSVRLHYPEEAGRFISSTAFLAGVLREYQPDIVHGRAFRTWAECAAALRWASPGAALVQSFHGTTSFAIQPRRRRWAAFLLSDATTALVAVSSDLADRIEQHWDIPRSRVRVIPNGVDPGLFHPAEDPAQAKRALGIDPDVFVVGCVGSLRRIKNHRLLLAAFAVFRARHGRAMLLLVGDGPLEKKLRQQARSAGIAEWVRFCGRQAGVQPYLTAMDLFVQPSLRESSPTAVLEAMSCAVPVLATPSSGCRELAASCGLPVLVESDRAEVLASRFMEWAHDDRRRNALGRQGRTRVIERYSFDRMLDAYEQVYHGVLAGHGYVSACIS